MKATIPVIIFSAIFISGFINAAEISPGNLKCEYLENPIGIDTKNPRFSWQIKSDDFGIMQEAYQIIGGTDSAKVKNGNGDMWNSGEIHSATIPAVYAGYELQPFTQYYWKVKVKLQNGTWSDYSKIASFRNRNDEPKQLERRLDFRLIRL